MSGLWFTHDKGIIAVRATCLPGEASIAFQSDEAIEGGTSGSPVVTGNGRLLGVISNSSAVVGEKRCVGRHPAAALRGADMAGSPNGPP